VGRCMLRPYNTLHSWVARLFGNRTHRLDDVRILYLMKMTRRARAFLMVLLAPVLLYCAAQTSRKAPPKKQYLAFVGTYTTKTNSKGIYAFRYDAAEGNLTPLGVAAETTDPSFLVIHPNGKYLYAVNEAGKASTVSAFALNQAIGQLSLLNQLPALGEDPCYISLDRSGKFVLIANYTSGNIAVFPVLPDGKLGEHTALLGDRGTLGPNKKRQEGPHAHWIETTPDSRFALVADLGLDEVFSYKFNAATGALTPNHPAAVAKLRPGAGPRHIAMLANGEFVLVASELDSTVTSFSFDPKKGALQEVGAASTLLPGFSGRNDVAEIAVHPNGKFFYVSNRGNESIAIFSIDPRKGTLTLVGGVPTGGKEPRHFAIDPTGNYLLAENQLSDTIVTFRIDPATGLLTPTGDRAAVPSPVDLVFATEDGGRQAPFASAGSRLFWMMSYYYN
jgi:6-phosphogluconolactonase